MGGPTEQPTQTSQYNLAPEQKQILDLAMPGVQKYAASVPQRYQGSTVAGFDPSQTAGQEQVLGSSGTQQSLAGSGAGASQTLLNNPWDPSRNPSLQGAVDAAVRPITEQYQNTVRPAIRDEFTGAGQVFGGSRRNIAEGNAANSYLRNVGDTSSKLVSDEYSNNLGAQVKALGLLPQTQQAQAIPGLTTSGVGDVRQGQAQSQLNANVSGYNYDQLAPFLQSKELLSLLQGIPGGSTTTTANTPRPNQAMSALGGAAAGASLGSMLGPVGTAGGAGLGALLAFLR